MLQNCFLDVIIFKLDGIFTFFANNVYGSTLFGHVQDVILIGEFVSCLRALIDVKTTIKIQFLYIYIRCLFHLAPWILMSIYTILTFEKATIIAVIRLFMCYFITYFASAFVYYFLRHFLIIFIINQDFCYFDFVIAQLFNLQGIRLHSSIFENLNYFVFFELL